MKVTKRNGEREEADMVKSNKVLEWSCSGISGVSASDIAMKAVVGWYEGIPTTEIHKSFIDAAEALIPENHHYAEVQSRLILIDLLKKVYGDWDTITPLSQLVQDNTVRGFYDKDLFSKYSAEEWARLDTMIDHKRDYLLMGAGMKQLCDKYLTQDRSKKLIFETPQVAYALCAIAGLANYDPALRMAQIKKTYNAFSLQKLSLPTPVLAGVRQQNKQYASCILIDVDDSLESINEACATANLYAAKRAGLGINVGRIRPEGSRVGGGEVVHTGIVPFIRQFESAIKSCSQGGIRDASATLFLPIWHAEIEKVMVLKSPKVSEENAVRRLDYCPQWDSFLLKRATLNKPITLFSPHEVPDLYAAFYGKDREAFQALYEKYEQDETLQFRKSVPGRQIYDSFLTQASESGRQYFFMADHVNTHTPFKEPIVMSNLCVEVTLPTQPIKNVKTFDPLTMAGTIVYLGRVQLCILGAINLGSVDLDNQKDMEERYDILVTFLNELIDNQDYMVPQSYLATMEYRPLGIGVINFAYFLAKRGLKYNEQASRDLTHRLGEQMYYYFLKASNKYAQYKGKPLPAYDKLIYSEGKTLLDTYCKRVDELTSEPLYCDWPYLKELIAKYGVYNATGGALMPSESSSTVSNGTSAMDPIRSIITGKANKKISFKQVAPEPVKLKNQYHMLWDMDAAAMDDYIKLAAVFQKFMCQSLSLNLSYNPDHYPKKQVPLSVMMNHHATCAKYGIKTRYYVNTKGEEKDKVEKMMAETEAAAQQVEESMGEGCESGACAI